MIRLISSKTTLCFLLLTLWGFCGRLSDVLAQTSRPAGPWYQYTTVTVSGTQRNPLNTGVKINKGDYVYIEVQGKIILGDYIKDAYGDGLIRVPLFAAPNMFKKHQQFKLGALVFAIGNQVIPCGKLFLDDFFYRNVMIDDRKLVKDVDDNNYIPGICLLSQSSGLLVIDLNDDPVFDNKGEFKVEIYTLTRENHFNRNLHNKCPFREPNRKQDETTWYREIPIASTVHHTWNTYRGLGTYEGCQCAYEREELVMNTGEEGTFDYGFYNAHPDSVVGKHRHLILDMLTHDLFGITYRPIPTYNILR